MGVTSPEPSDVSGLAAITSGLTSDQMSKLGSFVSLLGGTGDVSSASSGTSTTDVLNNYSVYMGRTTTPAGGSVDYLNKGSRQYDDLMAQPAAYMQFYALNPIEQKSLGNKLFKAGIISDPDDMDSVFNQWTSAVDYAGRTYQASDGKTKITPWDALQARIGLSQAQYNKTHPTNTSRTTTSSSTSIMTAGQANGAITAMFQNELGRNPDHAELSRYRSMLIDNSKSNPTVETDTTHYDKSGNQDSVNRVSSGGYGTDEANNDLQTKIQADPEYGAYQAATTYMNVLEQTMAGGPSLAVNTGG